MTRLSMPGTRVLLVGTGTHSQGSGLEPVPAVLGTLTDLGQALVERCGLAEDNLRIFQDPGSPTELGIAVAEEAERADDVLWVHFVGHGLVSPSGELYLATTMTDPRPNRIAHTALAYAAVRDSLLQTPARSVVVVLDCCYSGRAVGFLSDAEDQEVELARVHGAYVLAAAGRDRLALAGPGSPHTAFTGGLIRLLTDGDTDGPRQLTLRHATRYLDRTLGERNIPRPQFRASAWIDDLVLCPNPAYRPPKPEQAPPRRSATADADEASRVCPYPGLASFGIAEQQWFFGRRRLTAELVARLAERMDQTDPLVVVGPSGAGKSSLLEAGLLPAIGKGELAVRGSDTWPRLRLTPTERPLTHLWNRLARLTGGPSALPSGDPADYPAQLVGETREMLRSRAGGGEVAGARLVLVVDQLEEVFTECSDAREREAYVRALCVLAAGGGGEPPALVVLGLRADFFGHCAAFPELRRALHTPHVVGSMDASELREAITRPAQLTGLELQPKLAELMLRELGADHDSGTRYEPGALPLLAQALRTTWDHRDSHTLTHEGYERIGGIRGAIAANAERVYQQLEPPGQEAARQLLLAMVQIGDGSDDTRRRVHRELAIGMCSDPAAAEAALDALAHARLVTLDESRVQITHEALLRHWPLLRAWINEDRSSLLLRQQLTAAADAWDHEGRDPSALYGGPRLAAVRSWAFRGGPQDRLTPLARAFLRASVERELHEQRTARLRTLRLRQLVAGLAALFLLASATTIVAYRSQQNATRQRDEALSQRVAGEAAALRAADPALALQLSLAAYRLTPTTQARSSLLSAFSTPYATQLTAHGHGVESVAFSPDSRILLTSGGDGTARLWDVAGPHGPRVLGTMTGHGGTVIAASFSPDGHTVATAGGDRTTRIWDVTDPRHPRPTATLGGHTDGVAAVVFSPDGRLLATASFDRTARLWDLADTRHPRPLGILRGHGDALFDVAFSPRGHTVATASTDHTARLWDITDPEHPRSEATLTGHTDAVFQAPFSPDGKMLATVSLDGTAQLWDVSNPERPRRHAKLTEPGTALRTVTFSPRGDALATAGYDNTARLWNITDPDRPGEPVALEGHTDIIRSTAFRPDGRMFATGGKDGSVRLWNIPGPILASQPSQIAATAFSPDGRTVVSAGYDKTARLWDTSGSGTPLATLTGHGDGVLSAEFSPRGSVLATGGFDRTARLWDVSDLHHPKALATLTGHSDIVNSVAYSPQGRLLATGSNDRTVRLWIVADPRHPRLSSVVRGATGEVTSAVFSPDGHVLATGSADYATRLWDVTDPGHPRLLATLKGHTDAVDAVAFSPDGHVLATGSADYTARLWDVTDPGHPRSITTLTGHTNAVKAVAFSPDGHLLGTAGDDHTARLWNVTDLKHPVLRASLTGHTDKVVSLRFSPDGHSLVTGSFDNTARLWETDPLRVARRICALARPTVTRAQWDHYFPSLAYRPPCS